MRSWFKKLFITIIVMLLTTATAGASVDVLFHPASTSVERNNFLTMGVIASADVAAEIDLIDANFNYNNAIFNNAAINSSIGSWPESKEIVEQQNGYIIYQKSAKGQADIHFDVGAGATRNIYSVSYKVSSDAALGATTFDLDTLGFLNIRENGITITGAHNQAQITILPDTTPPQTSASHSDGIYRVPLSVSLFATDPYGDLARIQYTTNGSTPNANSPIYNNNSPIAIPINAVTTLKFFGTDKTGNTENVNVRTYTVDTQAPQISGLVVSPNFAKADKVITINFNLSENMTGINNVSVRIGSYTATGIDVSYPDYEYYYEITGSEPEGSNTVNIEAYDGAGNRMLNSTEKVTFDFTPPSYMDPLVSAGSPSDLFIHFTASEALDTANTILSIDGNGWTYQGNTGLRYVYKYSLGVSENSRLVEVHGYDLAGNDSWNTEDWDVLTVSGEDIYRNKGQKAVTVDIRYEP